MQDKPSFVVQSRGSGAAIQPSEGFGDRRRPLRPLGSVQNKPLPNLTFGERRVLPAVAAQNDFTLAGDELKARRDAGRACSRSLE